MAMSNDHGLRLGGLDCDRYLSIVIWLPFLLKVTSSIKVRIRSRPRPLDAVQLIGIDRSSKNRDIVARPIVADDEPGRVAVELHLHSDSSRAIRFDFSALSGQFLELAIVLLTKLGTHFEVAMKQGVDQCFLERDPTCN